MNSIPQTRKAQLNDFDSIASLILEASGCVFIDILQSDDLYKITALLKYFYDKEDNKFSYQNFIVYEADGTILACLNLYHSQKEIFYNNNMSKLLNDDYHIKYTFPIEATINSYYIDTIGVAAKARHQGIATKMISEVISQDNQNVSLIADSDKPQVVKLYQKIGFEIIHKEEMFGRIFYTMLYRK
ncbi:MAG: GNAT family N-acetyltransferase [Bacilli bacterium]|nr:GNAT family N-acetyltransferase [Bacilli bacterium]